MRKMIFDTKIKFRKTKATVYLIGKKNKELK